MRQQQQQQQEEEQQQHQQQQTGWRWPWDRSDPSGSKSGSSKEDTVTDRHQFED